MFKLDAYRAAIAHKTEIRESNRGSYTVFDYVVALKDTFDSYEARNARGIAFDNATGEIVSLPYEKFHNFNECDGWREQDIDLTQPHVILEKLDGSMIRTIKDDSALGFHFGTRAGVTDVSKAAWEFLMVDMNESQRKNYIAFMQKMVMNGFTVIFEYVSPSNRIVIYYDRPQLILTAIRNNMTGIYTMYEFMVMHAGDFGVPVVQKVASEHSSITDLANHVKNLVGEEGVVVRFHDGKMVKMKAEDYVRQHKALDGLRFEKDVLQLIFTGQLDDVLPLVSDEIRERLVQYRDDVLRNVHEFDIGLQKIYGELKTRVGDDRKEFAIEAKQHPRSSLLFALYNDKYDLIAFLVGDKHRPGNLKTQKEVDGIRDIIGPKSWYYYGVKINTGDDA